MSRCNRLVPFRRPTCDYPQGCLTQTPAECSVWAVADHPDPTVAAEELRAAFRQYSAATGWPWKVSIRPVVHRSTRPGERDPVVLNVALNRDDARALADLVMDAAEPEGHGPRGPIGAWIGTADVARRVHREASTIRGWLARNGPKANPFPAPDMVYRGRSYWQKKTIDRWWARQRRIDRQPQGGLR